MTEASFNLLNRMFTVNCNPENNTMNDEKTSAKDAHETCHNPCEVCNRTGLLENGESCSVCGGTGCTDDKQCSPAGGLGCKI